MGDKKDFNLLEPISLNKMEIAPGAKPMVLTYATPHRCNCLTPHCNSFVEWGPAEIKKQFWGRGDILSQTDTSMLPIVHCSMTGAYKETFIIFANGYNRTNVFSPFLATQVVRESSFSTLKFVNVFAVLMKQLYSGIPVKSTHVHVENWHRGNKGLIIPNQRDININHPSLHFLCPIRIQAVAQSVSVGIHYLHRYNIQKLLCLPHSEYFVKENHGFTKEKNKSAKFKPDQNVKNSYYLQVLVILCLQMCKI